MTTRPPFELTDDRIERMLADEAGPGTPVGFVAEVLAAVAITGQVSPGLLGRLGFERRRRRSTLVLVGVALLVALGIVAILAGAFQRRTSPIGSGPLIVLAAHEGYADVYTLDIGSGARTMLGSIQLNAQGQRIRWAADGRHALVYGDESRVTADVDVATRGIVPLALGTDGQEDAVAPTGDRIARLLGATTTGLTLSVVDLSGKELAHVALPAGASIQSTVSWAPDGSAVLLAGCLGCDVKADPTAGTYDLFLVHVGDDSVRALHVRANGVVGIGSFSPDGSTIAFPVDCPSACDGGIALYSLADGSTTSLTRQPGDGAPAWSRDGSRIAFERGGPDGGIYAVARDGSGLTRLTASPDPGGVDVDRQPLWSPDDAWIAFSRNVTDTSLGDLMVVPSAGGQSRRLVQDAVADWGPTDQQVAAAQAAAVPTPATGSAGSEPSGSTGASSTASSASRATAEPGPSGSSGPAGEPAGSNALALGGGPLLVFQLDGTSGDTATSATAWTVDVRTGRRTVLGSEHVTADNCCPEGIVWTSDRRHAVLTMARTDAVADLVDGGLAPVAAPPAGQFIDTPAHDGRTIARVDEVTGTSQTIVIADLGGKVLRRIPVPGIRYVQSMSWSPDDRVLAVTGCQACDGPWLDHLVLVPVDGLPGREILDDADVVASVPKDGRPWMPSLGTPRWSPNGASIALAESACAMGARLDDSTCEGRLVLVDTTSGDRTTLSAPGNVVGDAEWSPDGRQLAYPVWTIDGKPRGITVVDRTGKASVTGLGGDVDGVGGWSPDGTWIVFSRLDRTLPNGMDKLQVWVVPAAGGNPRKVADHAFAAW